MIFAVGDVLNVDGSEYKVVGKITYRNTYDNCTWDEYRMFSVSGHKEAWLSIDDVYKEYSISFVKRTVNKNGYHEVDRGREVVSSKYGNVDVDIGEAAFFTEYEDVTEEKIISEEVWEDGPEYSEGYYLDEDEILFERSEKVSSYSGGFASSGKEPKAAVTGILMGIAAVIFLPIMVLAMNGIIFNSTISGYLSKNSGYTYTTSITGENNKKADVYTAVSAYDVDTVAKDIINAIKGETEYVQQDDSETNGSIGILTKNEYCIIYMSEDNESVLVQISDREYTYTTDKELYHAKTRSRRYYRRFYYSTGYSSDSSRYSGYSSAYSSYDGGGIDYNSSNTYNSYSNSVRQASVKTRKSSGGGISSGK